MTQPKNNNRNYNFENTSWYERGEFKIISNWIEEGANIIDLGAANGSLLKYLKEKKNTQGIGVESVQSGVDFGNKHGLDMTCNSIDSKNTYSQFSNKQFDFAICNVTLQMVMYPEIVIQQMKRISKQQIISIPNFAHISNRIDLLINGRMPKPMLHGYSWYNTGHIHQLSNKDFRFMCKKIGLKITDVKHLGSTKFLAKKSSGNLFSKVSIFLTESL